MPKNVEARGYKVEWLEESGGEEAGLKSATVRVNGSDAYGWLKTESGAHRWCAHRPSTQTRAATPPLL